MDFGVWKIPSLNQTPKNRNGKWSTRCWGVQWGAAWILKCNCVLERLALYSVSFSLGYRDLAYCFYAPMPEDQESPREHFSNSMSSTGVLVLCWRRKWQMHAMWPYLAAALKPKDWLVHHLFAIQPQDIIVRVTKEEARAVTLLWRTPLRATEVTGHPSINLQGPLDAFSWWVWLSRWWDSLLTRYVRAEPSFPNTHLLGMERAREISLPALCPVSLLPCL